MATITSANIVDFLDANLNDGFIDTVKSWPEEYSQVFNVGTSDKQSEKDSYMSGFGAMPVKPEGVAATYESTIQGPSNVYTHQTYALGYEITEEAVEDNLHAPQTFNMLPEALAKSAMETVEVTAANIFNNGFSTTGPDGVALFSTAHINLDGSTQANRPTTDVDLSGTSLKAALTAFEKFVSDKSLKRPSRARTVYVAPDNWDVISELLNSKFRPYSGNNEINAIQDKDLKALVGHYLTDTDAWFLLASKEDTKLKFFWRRKLGALRRGNDFDTTNLKHLSTMRFSVDYSHWMGTYGTSGG